MSKAADRLRERLSELECLPPDPWSAIEAWAERTRPLIAHFYPSLLDQFNQCTKAPPYPPYFHISARPTRWEDAYDYERRRDAERRNAESKARAAARYQQLLSEARQKLISLIVGMLDLEDLPPSPANQASTNVVFAQFDRSNVAIAGLSAGSNFTASATLSHSSSITEPQLKVAVKDLQRSLIDVQDQLNDIDERLCEYLSQILLNIRKLQFEQADLATVLGLVKESVDDLWAKDAWNAIKPQLLPKLAKAAEILIGATGHPLAQDIARGIAG